MNRSAALRALNSPRVCLDCGVDFAAGLLRPSACGRQGRSHRPRQLSANFYYGLPSNVPLVVCMTPAGLPSLVCVQSGVAS